MLKDQLDFIDLSHYLLKVKNSKCLAKDTKNQRSLIIKLESKIFFYLLLFLY